jgi:hypothetical protein
MPGFVYIMSNPSFVSGRIKIGKSDRDPQKYRKEELESTGVPEPFHVEYYAFVEDHDELERALHREFAKYRVRLSREFFDVPIHHVVAHIKKITRVFYEKESYQNPQTKILEEELANKIAQIREEKSEKVSYLNWLGSHQVEGLKDILTSFETSRFWAFRSWVTSIKEVDIETYNRACGVLFIVMDQCFLSTLAEFMIRHLQIDSTDEYYEPLKEFSRKQKYQMSIYPPPTFSNSAFRIWRIEKEFVVFWEDKEHLGTWHTCSKIRSLRDFSKYYKWDQENRKLQIVIDQYSYPPISVPPYLNFNTDGLFFLPSKDFKIQLRCISELTGPKEETEVASLRRGSDGLAEVNRRSTGFEPPRNLKWENIPNCSYRTVVQYAEEPGFFWNKHVRRELNIAIFNEQAVDQEWVTRIEQGKRLT